MYSITYFEVVVFPSPKTDVSEYLNRCTAVHSFGMEAFVYMNVVGRAAPSSTHNPHNKGSTK